MSEPSEALQIQLPDSLTDEQKQWLSNPVTLRLLQQLIIKFMEDKTTTFERADVFKTNSGESKSTTDSTISTKPEPSKPYSSSLQKRLFANLQS
jgi:hypothetical protein